MELMPFYRLTISLTFVLACFLNLQARTFVVCVGVKDYKGTKMDLRVSDNDAKVIEKVFSAAGASTTLLVDASANQKQVKAALERVFSQANADDAVIFFFSGHGLPGGLVCSDGKCITYQMIYNALGKCRAKHKMIFADACFSGKIRKGKQHSYNHSNQDVMMFLSSRTDEMSLETPYKNSLFTIYLERGLRGGADTNKDRTITAKELYDFVHSGVVEASTQIGYKQHPTMWGNFDADMPVIIWFQKEK